MATVSPVGMTKVGVSRAAYFSSTWPLDTYGLLNKDISTRGVVAPFLAPSDLLL